MFENRLKVLLFLLTLPALLLVLRLVQLQVVQGKDAADQAEQLLYRPPQYFPCIRGDITDRTGERLAFDAPSWHITADYGLMVLDERYLRPLARERFPDLEPDEARSALDLLIRESWSVLAQLTGKPRGQLDAVMNQSVNRIQRIKNAVSRRQGVETVIAEENMSHPLVTGLTQDQQVAARIALKPYPWFQVTKSHVRECEAGPAFAHVLGHMGQVDPETLQQDPYMDDPLSRYLPGELKGISGVEWLGESWMRGRRGRVHLDLAGRTLSPAIEARPGKDFRLSIDAVLQRTMYNQLAAAVESSVHRSGGCAILLDIPTRQVLAMVSYPAVDSEDPPKRSEDLTAEELVRRPFVFRAVREYYPPGSSVKPMVLAAALADGKVNAGTSFECRGRLFQDERSFACTAVHGSVGPIFAVQHSCNVYFYHVGELLGVSRMNEWMWQFGFGRRSGTGLPAEKPGGLPQSVGRGAARNMAIGQGELDTTPIQIANMAATLASGVYRPVTLHVDDPSPRDPVRLAIPRDAWRLVREGMFQVVNRPGGTAYGANLATLSDVGDYVLLGKTGSAEAHRRTIEWLYTCHFPNGEIKEVVGPSKERVLAEYPDAKISGWRSYRRWPSDDEIPTHAWFVGYLTTQRNYLDDVDGRDLNAAIAVVIEYAGHGGAVAAPVARQMMQSFILRYRGGKTSGPPSAPSPTAGDRTGTGGSAP